MSLNHLLSPQKPFDIVCNSINCKTFKIAGSEGSVGSVLTVSSNGNLEFNSATASNQRDLRLLTQPIIVDSSIYPEDSNLNMPVYRDGAFTTTTVERLCKVEISLSYLYKNSIGNLPFEIAVWKNNNTEVYRKQYGLLDSFTQLNKITDSFVVLLDDSSDLSYFIRKQFDDIGYIEIIPNLSYISVEIL